MAYQTHHQTLKIIQVIIAKLLQAVGEHRPAAPLACIVVRANPHNKCLARIMRVTIEQCAPTLREPTGRDICVDLRFYCNSFY